MRTLLGCLLINFILSGLLHAELTVDIAVDVNGQEATGGGQPIAIVPFGQQTGMTPPTENLAKIIANDLYSSGRFSPLPASNMPENPFQVEQIHFASWQNIKIPHLVIGRINSNGTSGYTIEFQLFDVFQNIQLVGLSYKATPQGLRQVAHQISDVIYQTLTGERGVFSTQVAYVTFRRDGRNAYKLYVADTDGANSRLMFQSREPILSPTWSPDGKRIAYVTYDSKMTASYLAIKQMAVYIQDLRTGKRDRVAAWNGINSAPSWSPDGSRLALSLSKDGDPEIYTLDLRNGTLNRLTSDPSIDTEPQWSPDGQWLAFTSDRSGKPQIYRMPINGGVAQRLTFEGNYNASPRFSPDGRKLALLHGSGGFRIAVLNLDNGQLDVLTRTTMDESPSFAPNGSMIIYGSGSELAAVSVDGRVHQRLAVAIGEEVREPAWSPFSN